MSGRTGPRSKTGCSTCRTRKVKCDEERPSCGRCRSAQLGCEWLRPARTTRRLCRKSIDADTVQQQQQQQQQQQAQRCRMLLPRDAFSLSTSQQLRNSLRLSAADREYFDYFPNSVVVAWVGKPWKWGFLHYLYRTVASDSPVVMRLMLAISASELESRRSFDRRLSSSSSSCSPCSGITSGLAHYGTALREFRAELELSQQQLQRQLQQRLTVSCDKAEEIVTAFFFLVSYENHFGHSWAGLSTHVAGVFAFLQSCGILGGSSPSPSSASSGQPAVELPASSKNLLLFIMYIALSRSYPRPRPRVWDCISSDSDSDSSAWLHSVGDDTFSDLIDQLFLESRYTNSAVFRGNYPTDELVDDMSVYHPLEFFHECSKLKLRLYSRAREIENGREPAVPPSYVLNELQRLGKRFRILIELAHRDNPAVRLRELQVIYLAVSEYHALEILCHHCICIPQKEKAGQKSTAATCHRDALNNIIDISQRLTQKNSRAMLRLIWPLTVAAEFADSPKDKRWIQETVNAIKKDTGTSGWLADVVHDIYSVDGPQLASSTVAMEGVKLPMIPAISNVWGGEP